jgi:DNA-binding transcriptional regulator YiaG
VTQRDLAVIGSCTTKAVRNWEQGVTKPPLPIVILLRAVQEGLLKPSWILDKINTGG